MTSRRTTTKDLSLSEGVEDCEICRSSFPFRLVQPLVYEDKVYERVCPICALDILKSVHGDWYTFGTENNLRKHEAALLHLTKVHNPHIFGVSDNAGVN